jgi:sterol desaturase/sphingolipid hydroxylase (fatty acid hydroxylase superfamily)
MNINDYGIIYYVYATGAFLIHSDILNNDHIIHHKYYKYNYGLLLPFFDMLFGTYMNYESKKKYIEIIE